MLLIHSWVIILRRLFLIEITWSSAMLRVNTVRVIVLPSTLFSWIANIYGVFVLTPSLLSRIANVCRVFVLASTLFSWVANVCRVFILISSLLCCNAVAIALLVFLLFSSPLIIRTLILALLVALSWCPAGLLIPISISRFRLAWSLLSRPAYVLWRIAIWVFIR